MTQDQINTYTAEITSNPRRYKQDSVIFKYLPALTEYVDSIEAPPDRDGLPMPFRQKLWHVINNDLEFQKGICECGRRCRFKNNKYATYCSQKCAGSSKDSREKAIKTCIEKYGVENPMYDKDVKMQCMDSFNRTIESKYGSADGFREHMHKVLTSEEANSKIREGLDRVKDHINEVNMSEERKVKTRDTIISKYGSQKAYHDYIMSKSLDNKGCTRDEYAEHISRKMKKTIVSKYGSIENFKAERRKNIIAKYGSMEAYRSSRKDTIISKYGSIEAYNESVKATLVSKYGSMEAYSKAIADAISSTKRKNNTFTTSSTEECIAQKLADDGIRYIRQYKCERYPFHCDFYLEDYDLFIEIQAMWTHGKRPFNPDDPECMLTLEEWQDKAKTSQFYINAIEVWTDSDVRKRDAAKANNINYLEIFSNDPDEAYRAICDYICIH